MFQTPEQVIVESRSTAATSHRSAARRPSRLSLRTKSRTRPRGPQSTSGITGRIGLGAHDALPAIYSRCGFRDRASGAGLVEAVLAAALTRAGRPLAVWRLGQGLRHRSRLQGHALSVVLVGAPADVRYVLRQVERRSGAAYTVVGVVLDGAVRSGDATQDWGEAHPALCYVGIEEVDTAVRDLGADAVVVAGPLSGGNQYIRDLG